MEKYVRAAHLLAHYGPLLTGKQLDVMTLHYEHDLSFAEIADKMGITRQAVQDIEQRTARKLDKYEEALRLMHHAEAEEIRLARIAEYALSISDTILREKILRLTEISDEELFGSEYNGI